MDARRRRRLRLQQAQAEEEQEGDDSRMFLPPLRKATLAVLCISLCIHVLTFMKRWSIETGRPSGSFNDTAVDDGDKDNRGAFFEGLSLFSKEMFQNTEPMAMRPWSKNNQSMASYASTDSTNEAATACTFDGMSTELLQTAFGGRRTLLIGDSTLLYFSAWLLALQDRMTNASMLHSLSGMDLAQANAFVNPTGEVTLGVNFRRHQNHLPVVQPTHDNYLFHHNPTYFHWFGFSSTTTKRACIPEELAVPEIRKIRPQILVLNFGLHWLHLYPARPVADLCLVERWWDALVSLAEQVGTRLVLIKTTNRIYEQHVTGDYKDSTDAIAKDREILKQQSRMVGDITAQNSNRTATFSDCIRHLTELVQREGPEVGILSGEDVVQYCTKGTFDDWGVQYLNQRIVDYIHTRNKKAPLGPKNQTTLVELFDDHSLENCQYTTDGWHYHPLNLMRLRVMANVVQALYPR